MVILESTTYYYPYISGITVFAQTLSEELVRKGKRVVVVTAQFNKKLPLAEQINGVEVKRVPALARISKGQVLPSWALVVWGELGKADVVLIQLPQLEGALTAILAKLRRVPAVVIYNCKVQLPAGGINWLIQLLIDFAQVVSCWLAQKIVVHTQDYASYSRILRLFSAKVVSIYPPIRLNKQTRRVALPVRKRRGEIWVGYVGRISTEKGVEYLLDAVSQLRKQQPFVKLVIAGPEPVGETKYTQKIKTRIKRLEWIVFLGKLSSSQLNSFYQEIDILVLPSINSTEAFGLVQVEAMFAGTPVVATNLPGVRMPIKKTGMGELVPVKNSEAITAALLKLIKNRQHYLKPAAEIRKIFSLQQAITDYESLLASIINR